MILNAISRALSVLEKFIISSGVLVMATVTIANVLSRNFFNHSFSFAEEMNQFLAIAITFVGVSHAATLGRHIRMSAIYDLGGPQTRKFLMLVITLFTSITLFALSYWAIAYVKVVHTLNTKSAALGWEMAYVYTLVPIGLGLAGTKYFLAFLKNLFSKEIYLSVLEKEHRVKQ